MKKLVIASMAVLLFSTLSVAMAADFAPGVSLGLSEGYNDNVLLTRTNREGGFVSLVSPGVSLALRSSVYDLKLAYDPTFSFYEIHSDFERTSHNASLGGSYNVSDTMTLTVSDLFIKSQELNNLIAVTNLGPIKGIEDLIMNTATGGVSYKIANNLTWTVGGSHIYSNLNGSNVGAGTTISNSYSANSGLAYELNPRSIVSVNAQYQANDYNVGKDSNIQNYTLGLTHKFTPTLSLAITGGAVIEGFYSGGNQTTDFAGSAALTKKFEDITAVLSVAQTIAPAVEFSQPLKTQTATLSLTSPLSERWTVGVLGSYVLFKSLPTTLTSNINVPYTKGEELRTGGNLAYKISQWASLGLSYNFVDHLDRTGGAGNYYNNIALLTFTFSLERPRADQKQNETTSDNSF